MGGFLDFEEVKRTTSFGEAVAKLGLILKQSGAQWRGACPRCRAGGDRALVITEGKGYFCFSAKAGGDVIALAAHVLDVSVKDAARFLVGESKVQDRTLTVPSSTKVGFQAPPESAAGNETKKFGPLSYLESDHMAGEAIGFSTEFAKAHGIGYAPKGTMRGYVVAPFRDEKGNLLGYIGLTPDCKLPADFTPNVVPFSSKKSA